MFNPDNDTEYFTLMNKDDVVLDFKVVLSLDTEVIEIKRFTQPLPIGFTTVKEWIESRKAPNHREHIEQLLNQCGINDLVSYLKITYALSLNDTFWVKPKDKDLEWSEVSLYTNDFSSTIARIAFDGGLYGLEFSTASPEFCTDGTFAKCWIRTNSDRIALLKRGSTGARNSGLEPYSEYYSSQLLECLYTNYVDYNLVKYHSKLASKCNLFTSESEGFAPMYKLVNRKESVLKLFEFYDNIGYSEQLRRMLIFDALSINTDRHLGNHGVIFDCETMKIKRMAPVFDNNQALLPYAEYAEFRDLDNYLKMKSPKIGRDFIDVAKYSLTDSIKSDLINLKGFKFKLHPKYNLDNYRLTMLEQLIDRQLNLILGKSKSFTIPSSTNFIK